MNTGLDLSEYLGRALSAMVPCRRRHNREIIRYHRDNFEICAAAAAPPRGSQQQHRGRPQTPRQGAAGVGINAPHLYRLGATPPFFPLPLPLSCPDCRQTNTFMNTLAQHQHSPAGAGANLLGREAARLLSAGGYLQHYSQSVICVGCVEKHG